MERNIAEKNRSFKRGNIYIDPVNHTGIKVKMRDSRFLWYESNEKDSGYFVGTTRVQKDGSGIEYIRINTGGEVESVFFAKKPFMS